MELLFSLSLLLLLLSLVWLLLLVVVVALPLEKRTTNERLNFGPTLKAIAAAAAAALSGSDNNGRLCCVATTCCFSFSNRESNCHFVLTIWRLARDSRVRILGVIILFPTFKWQLEVREKSASQFLGRARRPLCVVTGIFRWTQQASG